jgi:hypothetical protein
MKMRNHSAVIEIVKNLGLVTLHCTGNSDLGGISNSSGMWNLSLPHFTIPRTLDLGWNGFYLSVK